MANSLTLTTPPAAQRYDCQRCGACCHGAFDLVLTPEDLARLHAIGWDDDTTVRRHGDRATLRRQADGACIFLAEGQCRLHAQHGADAKPLACRVFPFRLVALESQVRVDLRFTCPAVAGNRGRTLGQHRRELLPLLPALFADAAPAPRLHADLRLTRGQACRIAESVEALLMHADGTLTERMVAAVRFTAILPGILGSGLEGRRLSETLNQQADRVCAQVRETEEARTPPPGFTRLFFRQLAERLSPGSRAFMAVSGAACPLTPEAETSLLRFYQVRLAGMGFCGDGTVLDGLLALWLRYPLTLRQARRVTLALRRPALEAPAIEEGLRIADAGCGTQLPAHRFLIRQLSEPRALEALIRWYGA